MSSVPSRPRRRGIGCLPGLVILVVLGILFVMAIDLAFAPWIYSVGGRTRLLPVWAGVGVAQTSSGPYTIHVWFSPSPSSSRLPSASVRGSAYVCTPTGKQYNLTVTGGASGRIWRDMDGHAFHLSAYQRPAFANFTGDRPPRLEFAGKWTGPNLQLNDEGTLSQAFLADGSLNSKPSAALAKENAVPITFVETTWWMGGNCRKPTH